ncbi:uncharacterized protein J8A68_002554 [[Candida] subhashii]|uniref:Ribosome biogenesis protein NOP53 n=1 Tax=[Candida] subhashii TaxID=561895 RepID=A0A8J5QIZ9_9ASCO|nr:uncharacterized protein J8A68_002554 [[Candida] subhashii]KAG7663927.1 hypothetical protein J8A68_002554 [[Candida] subhashii]
MSSETNRASKPQPSRKGRKAWRKNIDIQDVESGLQTAREKEILLGTNHTEDFIIDETPTEARKSTAKKLKTHEILTNKSKIPALLVKLSGGKYKNESRTLARIEKDGLINVSNKDIWDEPEVPEQQPEDKLPEEFTSTAEVTRATVVPKTLKKAPIKITENDLTEKVVHAGKSYNPSLESWKDLINKEYDVEYKRELTRQQMEEHREKIKALTQTLDDNMLSDSDDEEEEEEVAKVEENDEEGEDFKLSINKPTVVKIKTKTKRNREAKHKKRVELEQNLKDLKKQLKDLSNLDELLQKQQKEEEEDAKKEEPATKKQKKDKKLFKYNPVQRALEVKLSHELTNNLKNLKPEGNLFYDQMLSLQSSGKIEARVPVAKKKKYTPKVTEKWTYKDFK